MFDLAFENVINVSVVSHPSSLQVPADLEVRRVSFCISTPNADAQTYKGSSRAPLLINSCEVDQQFPLEAQAQADTILSSFEYGYKRTYWEGCRHGYAVRGDLTDPKVKEGKEGAFKAAVEWFWDKL